MPKHVAMIENRRNPQKFCFMSLNIGCTREVLDLLGIKYFKSYTAFQNRYHVNSADYTNKRTQFQPKILFIIIKQ